MASYNTSVVTKLIADALEARGYGAQTQLAEACGVRVQTVNKWKKGQTSPEPERWPLIEQALGIPEGTIAEEAGYRGPRLPPPGHGHGADYNSRIAQISEGAQAAIDAIIEAEERKQRS